MISRQSAKIDVSKMMTTVQKIIAHPISLKMNDANAQLLDSLGTVNVDKFQNDPTCSAKMIMFLDLLKKFSDSQDKLVVFSENLSSLCAIVHFLRIWHNKGQHLSGRNSWIPGQDFFFVHGGTDSQSKNDYFNQFNDESNNIGR